MSASASTAPLPSIQPDRAKASPTLAFDAFLIAGVAVLAIAPGYASIWSPALFPTLLLLDLWLLGYHHVISTMTRLTFDAESRQKSRFLIYYLPVLVIAGVAALAYGIGAWAVASVYFYWQWWHYTRQSYGIYRILGHKSGLARDASHDRAATASLYAVPTFGILWRSAQDFDRFLGLECWFIPASEAVVTISGLLAFASLFWWHWCVLRSRRSGTWSPTVYCYLMSHHAIFFIGYIAISHINAGWLTLNVWHNAQYILIVWAFNQRRFKGGVDPKAKFLSWLSQPQAIRAVSYFAVCLLISTAFYGASAWLLKSSVLAAVPAASLLLYQTINFHHYIVDTVIWRRPKAAATA